MSRTIPEALDSGINQQVLTYLDGLSAHSDVADALTRAMAPLGDVQLFCPDWPNYLYVVASTQGVIIAFAVGTNTICFRLDERMKTRALASGACSHPASGQAWVAFTLFRDDWPKQDLEFWARKAYVAAREVAQR